MKNNGTGTLPQVMLTILGYALVLLLGYADMSSRFELSFNLIYLVPISIIAWHLGKGHGLVAAFLCGGAWLLAQLKSTQGYSHPTSLFINAFLNLGLFVSYSLLLARFKESMDMEKNFSRIDSLTKVFNSKAFNDLAMLEIKRARRYSHALTAVYLDLDNFKEVDEKQGIQAGNILLFTTAYLIKKSIREVDTVARIGGDEFILLLPNTGYDQAQTVISRIHRAVSEAMTENGWNVTVSIGAATYPTPPESVDELIRTVDHLMMEVKNKGGNSVNSRLMEPPAPGSPPAQQSSPGPEEKKEAEAGKENNDVPPPDETPEKPGE
jgi:diguanylate cyclase (GGDEF)-like protein